MAQKTVTIAVLQRDIADGRRCDPYGCPIVLAIYRRLKTDRLVVAAWRDGINISDGRRFVVAPNVKQFMIDFDKGRPVRPSRFRFVVEARPLTIA